MIKTITLALLLIFIVLVNIALAQNGDSDVSLFAVSEGVAAAIATIALLLAASAGYGMAHQKLRSHVANEDIHQSTGNLGDRFVLRTEIVDLKNSIKRQFDDLKAEICTARKEE